MTTKSIYSFQTIIDFLKDFLTARKLRKQHQKQIYNFFNLSQPCLPDLKKCKELREQYKKDTQLLTEDSRCQRCILAMLQSTYIRRLIDAQQ